MRKIYLFTAEDGTVPVADFLQKSHLKVRKKFSFILDLISDEKNQLCEPYVKHFTIERYRMLYEIRLRASGEMVRIIFYKTNESIILMHAFCKHDKKDTEKALEYTLKQIKMLEKKALHPNEFMTEVYAKW